jgi:hypothetical protein
MSRKTQMDREEEQLEHDLENGVITRQEFNEGMRDLQREYREAAQQSAQDAYDREMGLW